MEDFLDRFLSWKSTVMGVISTIVALLGFFNLITEDKLKDLLNNADVLYGLIGQVIGVIIGIILIFHKKPVANL
jgi:hypothetical protein